MKLPLPLVRFSGDVVILNGFRGKVKRVSHKILWYYCETIYIYCTHCVYSSNCVEAS